MITVASLNETQTGIQLWNAGHPAGITRPVTGVKLIGTLNFVVQSL